MKKKIKLKVILLMFLLAVLTVLIVVPEKSNAITIIIPGYAMYDPYCGVMCNCPATHNGCMCGVQGPLPPVGF